MPFQFCAMDYLRGSAFPYTLSSLASSFHLPCGMDAPRPRAASSLRGSSYDTMSTESSESTVSSDDSEPDGQFEPVRIRPFRFHCLRLLRFAASQSAFRNHIARGHLISFSASFRFTWVLLFLRPQDWGRLVLTAGTLHYRALPYFRLRP